MIFVVVVDILEKIFRFNQQLKKNKLENYSSGSRNTFEILNKN